tara:strand:+ start:454 stop:666 length:213 start_codon:yes stop_codon:yes gene_type:complete
MLTLREYSKLFKIQSILVEQNNQLNKSLTKLSKEVRRDAMCQVLKNQQNKINLLSVENDRLMKIIEDYQN